jgi:hypothetical protein
MNDQEFLAAFRGQLISAAEWTHRAHVRCAYLHVLEMPLEGAIDALRDGIKKLNASHGLVETPDRGYHETLTRAWLTVIASTVRSRGPGTDFEGFAADHPHLLNRTLLRVFYSPAGMPQASRYTFVEPDLAPLPRT